MTIKEKLCEPLGKFYTETSKELEQIADDYAILFGEWLEKLRDSVDRPTYDLYIRNKTKELLKDFKELKGL